MAKRYVLIDDDADPTQDLELEEGPIYSSAGTPPTGIGVFLNDFREFISQSISVESAVSSGLYGPTYGNPVSYSCRIKYAIKNIISKNGIAAVSTARIYLDGSITINDNDRITFNGASPPILKVARPYDDNGNPYATIVYT
jgi:hypothetical protein